MRSLLPAGVAAAVAGVGDEPNLSRGNLLIDAIARGRCAPSRRRQPRARSGARIRDAPGRAIRRDHAAGETGGRRDDERRPDPERRRRSVVPRKHARGDARDGDGRRAQPTPRTSPAERSPGASLAAAPSSGGVSPVEVSAANWYRPVVDEALTTRRPAPRAVGGRSVRAPVVFHREDRVLLLFVFLERSPRRALREAFVPSRW